MIYLATAFFCTIIFFFRLRNAVAVYFFSMILYPNVAIHLGPLNFPVSRFVILALLLAIRIRKYDLDFTFTRGDKFMLLFFVGQIISGMFTSSDRVNFLINRFGRSLDIFIPYFVIRITAYDWDELKAITKSMVVGACVLGLFAIYESVTGTNLLQFGSPRPFIEPRMGMTRAMVTFGHPIYLGTFLGSVLSIAIGYYYLIRTGKGKISKYVLLVILLGAVASFSSGGFMAVLLSIVFMIFYNYRRHWKTIRTLILISILLIELISNRHFYNVIDRFTFSPQTAWYRTRLIEVALFEGGMTGFWIFGHGMVDPGWNHKIDGRAHTDLVNHFLLILVRFGLVGFIPYMGVIVTAIRNLLETGSRVLHDKERFFLWGFGGALFSVLMTMNSVSLFGQANTFIYIILAICMTIPLKIDKQLLKSE